MRHFLIKLAPLGMHKAVKKVLKGKVTNLSRFKDIADIMDDDNNGLSDSGVDDPEAHHVDYNKTMESRNAHKNKKDPLAAKSAVRLKELGPRLTFQMTKMEAGIFSGEVLYNRHVTKTKQEVGKMKSKHAQEASLKKKRRKEQEANVAKKALLKDQAVEVQIQRQRENAHAATLTGRARTDYERTQKAKRKDFIDYSRNPKSLDVASDDDAKYYEAAVGEKPEAGLFEKKAKRKTPYKRGGVNGIVRKRFKKNR
jgi:ribosome biogenesis protein SSF1/2